MLQYNHIIPWRSDVSLWMPFTFFTSLICQNPMKCLWGPLLKKQQMSYLGLLLNIKRLFNQIRISEWRTRPLGSGRCTKIHENSLQIILSSSLQLSWLWPTSPNPDYHLLNHGKKPPYSFQLQFNHFSKKIF